MEAKKIYDLLEHYNEQLTRAREAEADDDMDSRYWQGNADALEGVIDDLEETMREVKEGEKK